MNKGILQLALSGRVNLELEYREPRGSETGITSEHAGQKLQRAHALMKNADAFACVLDVIG